jgi:hypothetical protein
MDNYGGSIETNILYIHKYADRSSGGKDRGRALGYGAGGGGVKNICYPHPFHIPL